MLKKTILIFVAILAILGVSVFFIFENKQKQVQLPVKVELPPIFSVVGEITGITENGFKLKVLKEQNIFGQEKEFVVAVASSTVFSKIEVPQVISQENANTPILSQKAKFSDLKVKDNVTVESDVNLRNVSQFTAKSVQNLKTIKQ